jgi:hypothetical protein
VGDDGSHEGFLQKSCWAQGDRGRPQASGPGGGSSNPLAGTKIHAAAVTIGTNGVTTHRLGCAALGDAVDGISCNSDRGNWRKRAIRAGNHGDEGFECRWGDEMSSVANAMVQGEGFSSTYLGEIIRDLHENPSLRRKSMEQILDGRIDEEGGPLVYAMESEEDQQRSLDSTRKKLYRFLNRSPR